ncbi:MAG: hypothetical protein IPL28_04035 [Chloroflexi bacterium]|nr:hypothetical protein [Chloroflexota bacterium]MDA0244759.1 hypothetical protein [Chloroflexota bacterium]
MRTVKAQIPRQAIIPIAIPDLEEVRAFAAVLHAQATTWHGEFMGWEAEYHPELSNPPLDSKMTFTPADFCIGESGIWFFSLMWEKGHALPPNEFLDDKSLVYENKISAD